MQPSTRLADHLEDLADTLVLLAPGVDPSTLAVESFPGAGLEAAEVRLMVERVPRARERAAVVLVAPDLVTLRRAVTGLGNVGAARQVAVVVQQPSQILPVVTPRPEWPPLRSVVASAESATFLVMTFSAPAPVRPVLTQVGRAASPARELSSGRPSVGVDREQPDLWPPADPGATIALTRRLYDASVDFPPDVVLTAEPQKAPADFTRDTHPVLGRAPVVAHVESGLSWTQLGELSDDQMTAALTRGGPVSLGAVDEKLLNPIGFDREPVGPPTPLRGGPGSTLVVDHGEVPTVIDGGRGVSDADLPRLRQLPGIALDWRGGRGPHDYCRTVAGLATAGVPMVTAEVPAWARALLAPEVVAALESPVDLSDALTREEHSVRLRRAALRTHASAPWRQALADRHELQQMPETLVSVLLVTRRPEMLGFALRQVSRQRGVRAEVVLATHGFEPDPATLASFRASCDLPLTVVSAPPTALFGDVLNRAAEHAAGDVLLKMDDDDWYGPDFVCDLLLSRGYSGAEVVGTPAEFTFLEPLWLTTRRPDTSEIYRPFVAGGTIMVDRAAFRDVGGFRSTRKYVDANLLSAIVAAGGSVYRAHGLGYVLRRGGQGHTWDPGLGYFVTRKHADSQWRGFRPSTLLAPDPADLPSKPADRSVVR